MGFDDDEGSDEYLYGEEDYSGAEDFGSADCTALLPGLPSEWYDWPLTIQVMFTLTPATCTYERLYREYTRDSLEAAAKELFEGSESVFVHYRFHGRGFIPAYEWYAVWPLLRRGAERDRYEVQDGAERGYLRRQAIEGYRAPWEDKPDDTVFEIWNEPRGTYGFTRTLMLRAGGRTQAEARRYWMQAASVLRPLARAAMVRRRRAGRRG